MTFAYERLHQVAVQRLDKCYDGPGIDWSLYYTPRYERANFATRYHFIYPAIGHYIRLKKQPELADKLRPQLDVMYRGLLERRAWEYWHVEMKEETWPLKERNLTYAGRLATFIGFYIDAYGTPPAPSINIDGRSTTYSELSENLHQQMQGSPTCGISCYHHQSMVQCNAHLLMNNVLHDRLFGTSYAKSNPSWLDTIDGNLLTKHKNGPLFYFGTQPNDPRPHTDKQSLGADIWALFCMSGVEPQLVREWFAHWRNNITLEGDRAWVSITEEDHKIEFSSDELATAWAFCVAKELGEVEIAEQLRKTLALQIETGFERDPLLSGLYVLGEELEQGAFGRLVYG